MAGRLFLFVLTAAFVAPFTIEGAQQTVAPDAGCVQQRGEYTCNWSSFALIFERAHTVAVGAGPMDRSTSAQLRNLISQLGKTPVREGEAADLTFTVSPAPPNGINMGPMDHDLARLRVTASAGTPGGTTLLWAETFRGQGDRPWPAQVHALLDQFHDRFSPRH